MKNLFGNPSTLRKRSIKVAWFAVGFLVIALVSRFAFGHTPSDIVVAMSAFMAILVFYMSVK
jgi:hypothetical protein